MPAVKFVERLDLKQILSFMDKTLTNPGKREESRGYVRYFP